MSGCHVPISEDEILLKITELYNQLKLYFEQNKSIIFPYTICGHCHGIGKVVDDGIL